MKVFLKTVLAIGIVASSSLALAEGKFAYRQPLQGVNASPTFAMTKSEKQFYEENKANIEMCSVQKDEIRNWELDQIRHYNGDFQDIIAGYAYDNGIFKIFVGSDISRVIDSIDHSATGVMTEERLSGKVISNYLEVGAKYRARFHIDGGVKEQGSTYQAYALYLEKEKVISEKTENYDWCVANGYETAN
ncbi:hypothetical protein [Halomonas sp. HAL1]|uniref:hypothetical protein n=1 Tax=Halomonas sp. HAL1 TaxID=550984 RepID=UPI00022D2C32|nr:hypothetical protein [Halomonas sp. HAL1]EHA17152.1 hypothetical protein HAL1_03122 [Halomonas sp. HAL1]WKV92865.1 hypothetical protein Q3Y66_18795 [Halomonas sp. HAL1]